MNNIFLKSKNFSKDYPLAKLTWFNVGGSSKYFFQPANIEQLETFLKKNNSDLDIYPENSHNLKLIINFKEENDLPSL